MAAARRTRVGAEGSSGTIALELVDADDRPTGVTTSVPFAVEIQPVAQQMAMTALAAKDATSRMRVGSIETRSPAGEVAEVGRTARSTSRRPTRRCQRPNWLARHRQVASSVEIASADGIEELCLEVCSDAAHAGNCPIRAENKGGEE